MSRTMSRRDAAAILGVPGRDGAEVEAAFRTQVRTSHPDTGGTAERFQTLVEARRVLLSEPTVPSTDRARPRVRVTTRRDRVVGRWNRRRRQVLVRLGRAAPRVR